MVRMESIQDQLKHLAEHLLDTGGFELVDVVVKGGGNNRLIQFFIDREGGISVSDCAALTQSFTDLLDREGILEGTYRLEVSSPGLDRPLRTERDFQKNVGREVMVDFLNDGTPNRFTGTVLQTGNRQVQFKTDSGILSIPFASVIKAKIKLKW